MENNYQEESEKNAVERLGVDINCMATIHNMYYENYQDAVFFEEKAKESVDEFKKRRYLRAAAVFYVACVDAWLAQKVQELIENRKKNSLPLDEAEQDMLDIVCSSEKDEEHNGRGEKRIPSRYKLANEIKVITKEQDNEYEFPIEFIELDDYRNSFVHYADSRYEKNYNVAQIVKLVGNGSIAVEKVMTELGYPQDVPKANRMVSQDKYICNANRGGGKFASS